MKKVSQAYILFLLIISCQKKKEITPINKLEALTGGNSKIWTLNDISSNGKSIMVSCAKGDQYNFIKDSFIVNYIPNSKCFSSDETRKLSYLISDDQKTIIIDKVKYNFDFLSTKKMVLSHDGKDEAARISDEKSINSTLHQQETLTLIAN